MDDADLTGRAVAAWRLGLPYLAITLCVVVAAWLAWSRLL
jgi:hypothetical protein